MKDALIQCVLDSKIIAIVRGIDCDYTKLAQAMYNGGIRAIEVTFNQKDPTTHVKTTDAIRTIRKAMGDKMYVGAGTVTSVDLVKQAHAAGAQFIVSPDINPAVIQEADGLGMVTMPGALTPTEVLSAHEAGADFVKLFPAGSLGSGYIKAICGPLNHIRMLAVGGISEKNVAEYMHAGCVGVGVGGNLVNKEWIADGEFDKITALAAELIANAAV